MTPDLDDSVSIAESSPGSSRVRRTEAERIQLLEADPNCGEMEPHRVYCTSCEKWVNLGKPQTYALRPWEKHRARCDQKQSGEPVYVFFLLHTVMIKLSFAADAKSHWDLQKMKMTTPPQSPLLPWHIPRDLFEGPNQRGWLSSNQILTPKASRQTK